MGKCNNKKGFSIAELLAVMAIMAIMAAVSAPFVRDYIKDSAKDRALATLHVIAQGYRNFRTDYPGATITSGAVSSTTGAACSSVNMRGVNPLGVLFGCNYIQNVFLDQPFTFYVGQGSCPGAQAGDWACMVGKASAGKYASCYGARIDSLGNVQEKAC